MGRYDILTEVANKVQALDNDVKLKILTLLVEEGSKSITDISKELNMNFSTAHKYLEQLEAASLVASKQVSENRLKRLFTIRDFNIELSPKGLSELVSGVVKKGAKSKFRVLNEKGELVDFDEKLFSQKYLKRGMPRGTIVVALNSVLEQAYDGITLLELRRLFRQELEKRSQNINEVFEQIEEAEKHKRTYAHILSLVHPEALEQHANGDIFIKNLRDPKLLSFVHDMRGIFLHSATGKKIENLQEFLYQLTAAIKNSSHFVRGVHVFDSFNFMTAPLVKNMPSEELTSNLKSFFTVLENLNISIYISISAGVPRYTKSMSPTYFAGKELSSLTYSSYQEEANRVLVNILKLFRENTFKNIQLIYKSWNKKLNEKDISGLRNIYIANMLPNWQASNASYVGEFSRFDSRWKRWLGTVRTGEVQDITINLPRLALKTKSEKKFFEELEKVLRQVLEYIYNLSELVIGEFLRKYDTSFKSVQRGHWNYMPPDDFKYSIGITGLSEVVKILSGKSLAQNEKLAKDILKFCNNVLESRPKPIFRILMKEDKTKVVADRFYSLDSKLYKVDVTGYTPGIGSDWSEQLNLHELLPGGHCAFVSRTELSSALKKNFGLIKLV